MKQTEPGEIIVMDWNGGFESIEDFVKTVGGQIDHIDLNEIVRHRNRTAKLGEAIPYGFDAATPIVRIRTSLQQVADRWNRNFTYWPHSHLRCPVLWIGTEGFGLQSGYQVVMGS